MQGESRGAGSRAAAGDPHVQVERLQSSSALSESGVAGHRIMSVGRWR